MFYFPDVNGRAEIEIGYRLARAHWGQGYATEAVTAVRDYAFAALEMPRLIALIDPANTTSIRVAEKAGMRYEADVMTYNDIGRRVALNLNVRVNDLFDAVQRAGPDTLLKHDGVHFTDDGYRFLAQQVTSAVRSVL